MKLQRYPAYKPSGIEWIGDIPAHWEVKRLKYVFKFTTGFTPPSGNESYYNGGIPWVTIADLKSKYIKQTSTTITQKAIRKYKPTISPKGSLLYSFKLSVGKVSFTTSDVYTNEAIFTIMPNTNINLNYFFYSLPKQIIMNATENIYGAKILNQNLIKNAFIIIPPKNEQARIADFLDCQSERIDKAVKLKERIIERLEEQRRILIHRAVTRGLDPHTPTKPSGIEWIGEIPAHWEVKRFRHLFDFSKGLSITKENLQYEGIPCVNYGEIHSKYGFRVDPAIHKLKYVDEHFLKDSEKSLLKKGDFVFADTSEDIEGSGNFTVLDSDIPTFAGYHTIIARHNGKIDYKFLAFLFDSDIFRNQIRRQVKGVKVYSITNAILKDTWVWYPPSRDEQVRIVEYI